MKEPCDVCNTEKAKRLPISRKVATRAKKPLDIVHVDISPVNTVSIDEFKYALGFVDSFSRLGAVYLLRTKTEFGTKLLTFIAELGKPRKIVTDNVKSSSLEISLTFVYSKELIRSLLANTLQNRTVK